MATIRKGARTQAAPGGQTGVNGYFYKGGQFLPSTQAPPGFFRVKGKNVRTRREQIAPYQWEFPPEGHPMRSIWALVSAWCDTLPDGSLRLRSGIRDNCGEPITRDVRVRPGIAGGQATNNASLGELIDAYNAGNRWFALQFDEERSVSPTQEDSAEDAPVGPSPG